MTGKELVEAYRAGRRDFSDANLWGACLEGANLRGANLGGANLRGADLRCADLRCADLRGANLQDANLWGANLRGAYLRGAYLWDANLEGADLWCACLEGANLRGADLWDANLWGANLRGATIDHETRWPSPTMILLASWGSVSDDLCVRLMAYDASSHPKPEMFDVWAEKDWMCPYANQRLQRAAQFFERADLWPGWDKAQHMVLPAIRLVEMLISEKCKVAA